MGLRDRLLKQETGKTLDLLGTGRSLPAHISIADNRFALVDDLGGSTPWPQLALDVVMLDVGEQSFRTYFDPSKPYNPKAEAEDKVPICVSADNVTPDADAQQPQSQYCANCPMNAWGSDPKGGKGKACQEYKRVAVAVLGGPEGMVYRLGVPSGSHKNLRDFGAYIRTIPNVTDINDVTVRIEFESQGVLKFTPIGYVETQLLHYWADRVDRIERVLSAEKPAGQRLLSMAPQTLAPQTLAPQPVQQAHQPAMLGQGQFPPFGDQPQPTQRAQQFAPTGSPAPTVFLSSPSTAMSPSEFVMRPVAAEPTKRTRRTKAEMEAARAAEPGRTSAPPPGVVRGFAPQPSPFGQAQPSPFGQAQPAQPAQNQTPNTFGLNPAPQGIDAQMGLALDQFMGLKT